MSSTYRAQLANCWERYNSLSWLWFYAGETDQLMEYSSIINYRLKLRKSMRPLSLLGYKKISFGCFGGLCL
jgi:hypothetical protein